MHSFFTRRKFRRMLYSKPTVALVAFVALFLGYTAWNAYERAEDAAQRREEAAARLSLLDERKAMLEHDIEHLSTEEGIEEVIRRKYDMGRENERVVVIVERAAEPEPETAEEKEGFFARLFGWF